MFNNFNFCNNYIFNYNLNLGFFKLEITYADIFSTLNIFNINVFNFYGL